MTELMVPDNLPIEMIAEEVKESWRLKEVHVEKLMQKVSMDSSSYSLPVSIAGPGLSGTYQILVF